MREGIFIFLYGALCLTGFFLTPFWAMLAYKRAVRIHGRWALLSDRYFMLASSIAVLCVGDTMLFYARAVGNITYGLSAILRNPWDGLVIGAGLMTVFVGKAMLIWLADLEREPPVWSWSRWACLATIFWGAAVVAIEIAR